MRSSFILVFCFVFLRVTVAQNDGNEEDYVNNSTLRYDDYVYKPNIHTVQFHEQSWEYAPPIINIDGSEQLELSFDDLDGDKKQYSMSFQQCNADWTPSTLMSGEYMEGYFSINLINFDYSQNTLQKYTHYSIIFPQQNTRFLKSGNYIVYVYLNGDQKDLVLTRRFMIYDNRVSIGTTVRQTVAGDDQYNKQHLDFNITSNGYDITNPYRDMLVVITQNNRWDNAVSNLKPTFLNGNQLIFSLDDASTFNGGNEFRYFDIRSVKFLTERVKEFIRDDDLKYHAYLYPDESRAHKPYLFYNDFNGNFLIKNRETRGNMDLEADYVYVDFFLPYVNPVSTGNFYILGKLTDWRMNNTSKLTYNYKRMGYEARLYLKQGYYNYIYVLSNDKNRSGDETLLEGNHWDTENDYAIFVYHRKFGTYYDQLIGYKKINTLRGK